MPIPPETKRALRRARLNVTNAETALERRRAELRDSINLAHEAGASFGDIAREIKVSKQRAIQLSNGR